MDQPDIIAEPTQAGGSDEHMAVVTHHSRQRRALAGGAVILTIVTGAGGYVLGNNKDMVSLRSDAYAGGSSPSAAVSAPDPGNAVPTPPPDMLAANPASGGASGPAGRLLISRRSPDGVELRAWAGPPTAPPADLGFVQPRCVRTGAVIVAALSGTNAGIADFVLTADSGPLALTSMVGDLADSSAGELTLLGVVNVDAQRVEVTLSDGSTDSMTPVDGLAVFATGVGTSHGGGFKGVTAIGSDGTRSEIQIEDSQAGAVDCEPRLPDPGAQPADPAAAKAAIVSSLDKLFDPNLPIDQRISVVDDPTGLERAFNRSTSIYPQLVPTARYHLTGLIFTSPTEAALKYDVSTAGGLLSGRFTTVHLIDGTWKVPRASICADLSTVQISCDPEGPPASTNGR